MQEIPKTQNIKTLYEQLPPKIIVSIKSWNYVHNLIGPYAKYIIQKYPGGTIVNKYVSLTFMMIIDPSTVCFNIVKFPWFNLE